MEALLAYLQDLVRFESRHILSEHIDAEDFVPLRVGWRWETSFRAREGTAPAADCELIEDGIDDKYGGENEGKLRRARETLEIHGCEDEGRSRGG